MDPPAIRVDAATSEGDEPSLSPSPAGDASGTQEPALPAARPGTPETLVGPSYFRQRIFAATVPLRISLDPEIPPGPVKSFYMLAPRVSYLPLLVDRVVRYYASLNVDACDRDAVWFSHEGTPLRWHLPLGVLYDFHGRGAIGTVAHTTPSPLPFEITLHIGNIPLDALYTDGSIETSRSAFMNMVKQAEHLRSGNVKRVTTLRKEEQDSLWDGLVENSYDKYLNTALKLVPGPPELAGYRYDEDTPPAAPLRNVPIRAYLPENLPVVMDLAPPVAADGTPLTILHYLSKTMPLLFPSAEDADTALASVITHGIVLPLDTDLAWLASILPGPDGWIHLVVVLK